MIRIQHRYQAVNGMLRAMRPRHVLGMRPASTSDTSTSNSRIERVSARCKFRLFLNTNQWSTDAATVPKFLRPTIKPVLNAPISHITSFLILHELTAVVPLISLAATFHYTNWLPPYITEGAWVKQGMERFGPYLRRKGWLGEQGSRREGTWRLSESSVKIVVEVASAWAITKALLPVRLVVSVWGTPWFARSFVLPMTGWIGKIFGRGKGKAKAPQPAQVKPQVKNEGPLYNGRASAPINDVKTPSGTSATGGSPAAGTGAAQGGVLPPGVKVDGPLYKHGNGA